MKYINNKEKLEKIKLEKNNFYIVIDFDRTITANDSPSTWGALADTNTDNKEYYQKRTELYNFYRPIEIDSSISDEEKSKSMSKWWTEHINLFFKYGLEKDSVQKAIQNQKLKYRNGAKEFLRKMNELDIPVIIVSAGIGNIIEEFLRKENDLYTNIKIISNFIEFENGKIKQFKGNVIHSLNKNIIDLDNKTKSQISDKDYIMVLGDGIADLKMISENLLDKAITIGFLDEKIEENLQAYNENFDIVLSENESFDQIIKLLNI